MTPPSVPVLILAVALQCLAEFLGTVSNIITAPPTIASKPKRKSKKDKDKKKKRAPKQSMGFSLQPDTIPNDFSCESPDDASED